MAGALDAVICRRLRLSIFALLLTIARPPSPSRSYGLGLTNKLMGQVNLALAARETLREGGSITLIAGVLADTPIVAGSSASMVNGCTLRASTIAAAIEMPRGIRINVVSPTVFTEELDGGLWAVLSAASIPFRSRRGSMRLQPAASKGGRRAKSIRWCEETMRSGSCLFLALIALTLFVFAVWPGLDLVARS